MAGEPAPYNPNYAPIQGPPEPKPVDKTPPKEDDESSRMAAYWRAQINAVDEANARWHERGNKILKRYRDERERLGEEGQRRYNVLWSTIAVMLPALYSKMPKAIAERKFLDRDPVGRISATILERALRNELAENGFHSAMKLAVKARLLPGRGQVWVRYEPKFEKGVSIAPLTSEDMKDAQGEIEPEQSPDSEKAEEEAPPTEELVAEKAMVDYINWRDFYIFPANARTWDEVQAVGKKLHMSEDECIDRFGEEIGSQIQPDPTTEMLDRQSFSSSAVFRRQNQRKRVVVEIWNKTDRKAYWVSTGYDFLCDVQDDPLELDKFFPCPEPLSATMTDDSMIPVADYHQWQDQALQVDELTQRISLLSKALKISGTYDATQRALRRLLNETPENEFIPVENWAMHREKGGIAGGLSFFPLKEVGEVLQGCVELREKIIHDIDMLTGISDILRGTSDARETLGGQKLKSNNASNRIETSRDEVARFARDTVKLVAEVIAKHFDPQTLIDASGIIYEDGIVPDAPPAPAPQAPSGAPALGSPQGPPHLPGPPGAPPSMPPQPGAMPPPADGAAPGGPVPPQAPGTAMVPHMASPPMSPGGMAPQPPMPPAPPQIPPMMQAAMKIKKAIDLLKCDICRSYRIDIETDSTIMANAEAERADAIAFVKGVTEFMVTAGPIAAGSPAFAPLIGKMLQFAVRKFRTGRDLESAIDEAVEKMEKASQSPHPAKPTPEQIKAQSEQVKAQTQIKSDEMKMASEQRREQAEIAKAQMDAQAQEKNDQREAQIQAANDDRQTRIDQQEQQFKEREFAMKMQQMEREQEFRMEEHRLKMEELHTKSAERQSAAATKSMNRPQGTA